MLLRWLVFILWMSLIFITSSVSVPDSLSGILPFQDKLVHFVEFGVLGIFLVQLVHQKRALGRASILACMAGIVLYGAFIEFYQSFVPGRSAQWGDFAADCFGAFIFVWAWLALKRQNLFAITFSKQLDD